VEEAILLYQKCLVVAPNHQEARASLTLLSKGRSRPNFNIDFLDVGKSAGKVDDSKGMEMADSPEESSKKKSRRSRRKRSSSSSSSSSTSSSSRFSSSGSNSSRERSHRKKSRSRKAKRDPSLSPFSKKMAQLNPVIGAASSSVDIAPVPPPTASAYYPSTEYPTASSQAYPVPAPQFGNGIICSSSLSSFACFNQ